MSDEQKTRIVIADDHTLFRAGLRAAIEQEPGYTVVGESIDGEEALQLVLKTQPDVLVTDINMPGLNGIDLARKVIESDAPTEVILLTMYNDAEFVREGIHRGAMGYLLKDGATGEIVQAIESARNKQFHLGEGVRQPKDLPVSGVNEKPEPKSGVEALSPTKRRVVLMIAQEFTSAEIADQLRISVRTVETHRLNASRKLGLSGANSLLRFALANSYELEALID